MGKDFDVQVVGDDKPSSSKSWLDDAGAILKAGAAELENKDKKPVSNPVPIERPEEPSFFMKVRGGAPTWAWFTGGAIFTGIGALAIKLLRKGKGKRRR